MGAAHPFGLPPHAAARAANPPQFGLPTAKALAAATGDSCIAARKEMPAFALVRGRPGEECACEPIDYLTTASARPGAANRSR